MSNAFKCDRCYKHFDEEPSALIDKEDRETRIDSHYDLCSVCYTDFLNFINHFETYFLQKRKD